MQPLRRTPNAGSGLAKLSKSFSPVSPSRSPQDRAFPLARHPLTGEQRLRAGRGRLGAAEGRGGRSQVPGGPSAAPDRSPGPRKRKRKRRRGSFPNPPLPSAPYPPPSPRLPVRGGGEAGCKVRHPSPGDRRCRHVPTHSLFAPPPPPEAPTTITRRGRPVSAPEAPGAHGPPQPGPLY